MGRLLESDVVGCDIQPMRKVLTWLFMHPKAPDIFGAVGATAFCLGAVYGLSALAAYSIPIFIAAAVAIPVLAYLFAKWSESLLR